MFIVNLETAVADRGRPWPAKGIQYRMHPANVECLSAAGIDVAVLANNHVLDWSAPGLDQTLDSLRAGGISTVGAGRSSDEAWASAVIDGPSGSRTLVLAAGSTSSGIPPEWAVERGHHGVASLHWGGNWGYEIPKDDLQWLAATLSREGTSFGTSRLS